MALSNSRFAYADCYAIFDRAVEDAIGARAKCESEKDAIYLRMRLNTARKINRKENAETYEEGNPLHGRSAYDKFACRVREVDGEWYVYVERHQTDFDVEGLSGESNNNEAMLVIEKEGDDDELALVGVGVETETKPDREVQSLKRL